MADKVKPLKIESSSGGGTQNDMFPTEVNPTQDYLASKGIAFENNDNRVFDLDGSGNIQMKDATETSYYPLWKFKHAIHHVFAPGSSGLVSVNSEDAIKEVLGKIRFPISTSFVGKIQNGDWLGYNESLPGNQVPIRVPVPCHLKEIRISYRNTNLLGIPTGGNLIDGRFDLYKNGLSAGEIVHQETFTNQADGKLISGLNIAFSTSDYFVGRWVDAGDNPSDMVITYYFGVP